MVYNVVVCLRFTVAEQYQIRNRMKTFGSTHIPFVHCFGAQLHCAFLLIGLFKKYYFINIISAPIF